MAPKKPAETKLRHCQPMYTLPGNLSVYLLVVIAIVLLRDK